MADDGIRCPSADYDIGTPLGCTEAIPWPFSMIKNGFVTDK